MRILIVDDDPATLSFLQLAFDAAGDQVATASDVESAMREATATPPDVVVSDLTFARHGAESADGFSLLRRLRSHRETSSVGVLAVSGLDAPEAMHDVGPAGSAGFDGFVRKPVDVASLIERVHRLGAVVADRRGRS